jgi:hypothetical protein
MPRNPPPSPRADLPLGRPLLFSDAPRPQSRLSPPGHRAVAQNMMVGSDHPYAARLIDKFAVKHFLSVSFLL